MAIGKGAPENEVRPLDRIDLSAVANKSRRLDQFVLHGPQVQHKLAIFKSRTELRAIAAVFPTRPGLGGLGLCD